MTRAEKEMWVTELYNQGKTTKEMAKRVHMSFRDIGRITKKLKQEAEREKRRLEGKGNSNNNKSKSKRT